jgi:hypothetical protein
MSTRILDLMPAHTVWRRGCDNPGRAYPLTPPSDNPDFVEDSEWTLGGNSVHVEAYEVVAREGWWVARSRDYADEVEAIHTLAGGVKLEPMQLPGVSGLWLVALTPYSA